MVIVIVGGIKAGEAAQIAAEVFGDWEQERPERAPLPKAPALDTRREGRETLEDKSQSSLVLGWPGPERRHEDFIPCFVANTVLGIFGMYGRLGQRIREQNGLAYYVYSKLSGGTGPGPWRVMGGFDPENVDQGLDLILDEIRALRDAPIPRDELEDSQSYLIGSLPLHLETNEGVARSLVNIERHDLGLDYLRHYQAMIREVTAKEIQAAVRRWMDPEAFALAVAGPGETP
jgi:zinc protease